MADEFFNPYNHDFVRLAVAVPELRVADPAFNAARTTELIARAEAARAALVIFPELGLSAYSCDDLFQQQALLDASLTALKTVRDATRQIEAVAAVGLPLAVDGMLFNCAAVIHRGRLLGVVPKSHLPNYREFYEMRQFAPAHHARRRMIELLDERDVPFGPGLLFQSEQMPRWTFHVEICEDLWVPIPPSSFAALAGATVLVNLSASNITIGKDDYRRQLVSGQSGRCLAAYAYCAAGTGESTTDLAWDGHGMIYENGSLLAETTRFELHSQLVTADVDLERLAQDRMRQTSFGQAAALQGEALAPFRTIRFCYTPPRRERLALQRRYERFPYVPADPARRDERCRETYDIQVQGLVKRMTSSGTRKLVIGVSGGLDSTQALIVCARAVDLLGLPRGNILAYTMPGFATGDRTLAQARRLMAAIGCTAAEIDIRPSCLQMLRDIGHPFADGKPVHDVTFENVQAGERTSHLFRLANLRGGFVVGTSDLSEMALGWSTYGVGDHMAHYHVNASVPKTLIRYLIHWVARSGSLGAEASNVLDDVLTTVVSPELVPGDDGAGQPAQRTEDVVGPYELQDFHLYWTLRFGFAPPKVAYLAWNAWRDRTFGLWPDIPVSERNQYSLADIRHWLGVFLKRFFEMSQYKRSCVPNAPKVGSGGSLSPRGDYRAPSDSVADAWLTSLARIPEVGNDPDADRQIYEEKPMPVEQPAAIADIRRLLADIDDVTAAEIMKLKPTLADLDEAMLWLAEGDDTRAQTGRPHRHVAAAIVDMLGVEDEEERLPDGTRSEV
jgi:NAD+ synthase (glutamine-hydrolysing)